MTDNRKEKEENKGETPEGGYQNLHEMIDSVKDYKFIDSDPDSEQIREYERNESLARQEAKYRCNRITLKSELETHSQSAVAERENEIKKVRQIQETRYSNELTGNIWFQTSPDPEKFIVASKKLNRLIEMRVADTDLKDRDGSKYKIHYLEQKRTFLMCIPTRIIRHKKALYFMPDESKFTIVFVDTSSEVTRLAHRTLSEIMAGLRDHGLVVNDGSDYALNAMIQACKETGRIENNDVDVDLVGFFTDRDFTGKENATEIIASNIGGEINKVLGFTELSDALALLEELKEYYEGRLDLLATSIVWGMYAPLNFALKEGNNFLRWLFLHGESNATKTTTGLIILAIDGHHNDPKYNLGLSSIDTSARLGETVAHTTFPKVINEVNLSDESKSWFVDYLKIAIESKIARSKFKNPNATEATPIPSLTPLIMTSNFAPPNDSGFMRKVLDRTFPPAESKSPTHPKSIEFENFLLVNLNRLKPLGNFRNWYIMNNNQNQKFILEAKKLKPLDLGYKILTEAYKNLDREIPDWLSSRLPENQLEESIGDKSAIVKNAFEKYIIETLGLALSLWRSKDEPAKVSEHSTFRHRITELAYEDLLPSIKKAKNGNIIIRRGDTGRIIQTGSHQGSGA